MEPRENWNKNSTNGKINNQSQEEILNHGLTLPIDTWEKDIQSQTGKENIEAKRDIYLQKINLAKQKELEKFEERKEEETINSNDPKQDFCPDDIEDVENQLTSQDNQAVTAETQSSKNTFKEVGLPIIFGVSAIGIVTLLVSKLTTKTAKRI